MEVNIHKYINKIITGKMLNIQRVLQTNLGYAKVNGNITSCLHIMNYSHNVVGDGGIYRKGKLIFKMLSGTELQV